MVVPHDLQRAPEARDVAEDVGRDPRLPLEQRALLLRQRRGLPQQPLRQHQLADVVQEEAAEDVRIGGEVGRDALAEELRQPRRPLRLDRIAPLPPREREAERGDGAGVRVFELRQRGVERRHLVLQLRRQPVGVGRRERLLEVGPRLQLRPEHADGLRDRVQQLLRLHRLGEVRRGPERDAELPVGRVGVVARVEDRRDVGEALVVLDRPAELKAVEPRHQDVGHDEVGAVGAHQVQGGLTVPSDGDLVPGALEDRLERPDAVRQIVHDQCLHGALR